ncbi:outer membrane protein [Luteibacter aegosomatissinici]|uniref:outer membrane protein n=1 Tax=Luteibacter aegosomatissinici TaxID=2911539 RepID=UPI001FFAA254|nr:outer membrane beta-barrel protein [Luteibacter aegosomatissinici]UPG94216.1 porin family protein [Luteibacter aegosomatissinici]
MQKVLLSAAAAAALSLASFSAAAVTQQGAFIGVNGGQSHYDISHSYFSDHNDTAVGVVAGYRWVVDRPFSLGVEVGYADLGNMKGSQALTSGVYDVDYRAKFKGEVLLVGANGKWDLPHGFTITARAGFAHSRSKYNEDFYYTSTSACCANEEYHSRNQSTDNGVYGGLGFGYDFNENFGITLTYDHYALKAEDITSDKRTVNVGVTGLAAEYRFW